MLLRNPRWIKRHTPRYVPPPSVLVPAIQHVFNVFGNACDAESGQPLFNKTAWQKANAVLELAREGYLSDIPGVTVYDKAGVDKYGLNLYESRRGTNDLEGGPHSDIYRKFGALHAAPRLTVNSLADHRTHYNLQAMAKHEFGVNWDYHHHLALINRTSFLLNYLSDIVDGADSYADWINESLRAQVDMEPYDENNAKKLKLNSNNDWLRRRQGLALPILPPTTPEGRKYFFSKIGDFVAEASANSKRKINFVRFAKAWNGTADGKTRFYVTADVLAAYSKSWDKTNNSRASQELIEAKMDLMSAENLLQKSDWIGQGKVWASAPPMVRKMAKAEFTIPQQLEYELLPSPFLSIAKMLEFSLPLQASLDGISQPAQYFSMTVPDMDKTAVTVLRLRHLPTPEAKVNDMLELLRHRVNSDPETAAKIRIQGVALSAKILEAHGMAGTDAYRKDRRFQWLRDVGDDLVRNQAVLITDVHLEDIADERHWTALIFDLSHPTPAIIKPYKASSGLQRARPRLRATSITAAAHGACPLVLRGPLAFDSASTVNGALTPRRAEYESRDSSRAESAPAKAGRRTLQVAWSAHDSCDPRSTPRVTRRNRAPYIPLEHCPCTYTGYG
ncbi:hypothetical protein B0H10DRAFT_2211200 [Mycena sp. CBHHK59/15]|nr:hypothetical protein B0H10DRAFT_2211200 [Mycena sp. CBHHK59/15]